MAGVAAWKQMCNDKKLGDPDHFGSILDTREWGIVHRQQEMSLQELQVALENHLAKQKPMPLSLAKPWINISGS